ncbi:MAG TPA: TIGR03086 family metal-binding protein [Acidimicrobiia bacterium]|nr:TIGR03086 family metal-binding protein [Acidimicrobiia bacterium]
MSDLLDRYRRLADGFTARVEAVPDGAWDNSSPCEEWKARDVVGHVAGLSKHFVAVINGVEPPAPAPLDDPVTAWAEARAGVEAVLADPDQAGSIVETPMGDMPFEVLMGQFGCMDLLIHTWDLARAAGLDESIDPDAAANAYEMLKPMDEMLRGPGIFKPAIEPPADADIQTKLLSFLGRQV